MYRGFKIEPFRFINREDHIECEKIGRAIFKDYIKKTEESLDKFVLENDGVLNGTAIQSHWFPVIENNFDVFISHSHNDERIAFAFAGWLKENFGLISFLDKYVWASADGLIRKLDELNQPNSLSFDYKARNMSTSQVHAMLTTAIFHMIDNCECFFFLKTDKSVPVKNIMTFSPWIYLEVGVSAVIEKHRNKNRMAVYSKANENADFSSVGMELDDSHLQIIDADDLNEWSFKYTTKNDKDPLQIIYDKFPLPPKNKTIYD